MLPQRWFHNLPLAQAWRYAVILLGAVGLGALYRATGREVLVVIDGHSQRLLTHARTSGAVLRDLGLPLTADDVLSPAGALPPESADPVVELRTARPVLVQADTQTIWQSSAESPVENILAAAGLA